LVAFRAFEGYDRAMLIVGPGREPCPVRESGAVEIPQRRSALIFAATGDKEHCDVSVADELEEFQRRFDGRRDRLINPLVEPARQFSLQGAGAALNEAEIVGLEVIPIG